MAVTMRDVADRAGVSVKTVSNVVNGFRHVSPDMRARVQRALDDLGYRMNVPARSLRSGRTGVITLAVPELRQAYFAELGGAVVRHAEEAGLLVLVEQTLESRERETEVLTGGRGRLVDGVIFSPLGLGPDDLAAVRPDLPVVLLGERAVDGPLDHVSIDNVAAARDVVAHLVGLGRRRVAAVGVQPDVPVGPAQQRSRGYARALAAAGLPAPPELLVPVAAGHRAAGAEAVARLLDGAHPPPDAVFCFNDMLAHGALHELLRRGVRVPDDVALAGFDDVEESRFTTPPLTTVAPGLDDIARHAVALLRERMAEPDVPPRAVTVAHRLVVRGSTVRSG